MLLGRLELLSVLVLFTSQFWRALNVRHGYGADGRANAAAAGAYRAVRLPDQLHLAPLHAARVDHLQAAGQTRANAGQQLQRLGRLHRADDAHQRREHAERRARAPHLNAASGGNTQA